MSDLDHLVNKGKQSIYEIVLSPARGRFAVRTLDEDTKRFVEHNKRVWAGWRPMNAESTVLVDFHPITQTLISYSYFLNVLARKHRACVKAFSPYEPWHNPRLREVYRSFNATGYAAVLLNAEQETRKKAIVQEILRGIRTKQDVLDATALGVWIGIDIYESYLRQCARPTVILDDPKLVDMIDKGVGTLVLWHDYLERNRVAAVVVSHDVYVDLNILCKLAYQRHIPVYLPNVRGITLANKPFTVHECFSDFRWMFKTLSAEEQTAAISLAKRQLDRRFGGEVGVDMPYSTKSAFSQTFTESPVLRKSNRIKVLICTHCFYDNPHAYSKLPFVDFYEWLRYVGQISERTDYDWYLKMHPDPRPGTEDTIRGILREFPRITFIPPETSHHQLVREGISFVLTVYGTVGHEYPASGVQVINAAYNPRVAYDFNWHPKTLGEYDELLLNLDKLHKATDLQDLYEFYYMHHYYVTADDLIFNSYSQFLQDLDPKEQIGPGAYGYFLDQLTAAKQQKIIENMQEFIDSGRRHYFSRGPE